MTHTDIAYHVILKIKFQSYIENQLSIAVHNASWLGHNDKEASLKCLQGFAQF